MVAKFLVVVISLKLALCRDTFGTFDHYKQKRQPSFLSRFCFNHDRFEYST
ncbi:hypothetical protein FC82_GL001810 [Secundilactobacillus collinoides DSM 20515 = JCM 1123]|uniref:Uncharacterized protein n=1 Tax=Secundilactobacillus collinoides DSM 20515 = JCM 1123 TaxID=1423733 RepID=A0A0R2BG82_SECCO|nr:hypothetical protein FC82_GL001810 [Secundilactobacillus collinoides DSM 20515 = JCM 1123]